MSLAEIQHVSLSIQKDIHNFCVNNNISYTLCGGSLIGAIRHNGFIPWDDDLDIAMPRPDYERFINSFTSKNGYKVFSREKKDGKNILLTYARVCDMENTLVDSTESYWIDEQTGVWVDIFPLDGAESDFFSVNQKTEKLKRIYDKTRKLRRAKIPFSWRKGLNYNLKVLFRKLFYPHNESLFDEYIDFCKEKPFNESHFFSSFSITHYGVREWQPISILSEYHLHPFEDASFYVIKGYDKWLSALFGDYMQLPPPEKQVPGHSHMKFFWRSKHE